MSGDNFLVRFGQRGEGTWDATLPFRWLSLDGRCAIDLGIKNGALSDVIRPADLKQMVRLLLNVCVRRRPNEGGMAINLGENGNLLVRIVKSKWAVTCGAEHSGPPWQTCRPVIDNMPINGNKVTFGPSTDPETSVVLPWKVTAGSRQCMVVIEGTEVEDVKDTDSWYNMWLAANAVDYMCIHFKQQGVALDLGEYCPCQYPQVFQSKNDIAGDEALRFRG